MLCKCGMLSLRASNLVPRQYLNFQKRFKHSQNHWSVIAKKKTPKNVALNHFDDFYSNVFGEKWPSMRLALLSHNKYCAIVNNYSDTERITTFLENLGAMNLKAVLEFQMEMRNERKKTRQRKIDLNLIYKLDKKLEEISKVKYQEDLSSLYPQDSIPTTVEIRENRINTATRSDAETCERYIDGRVGLSAGALQEFVPATKLKGKEDWVAESQHYSYYSSSSQFPVEVVAQESLVFPPHLHVYTFEMGNIAEFPNPRNGNTGVSDYYLLDGGSILPVLALDLQPGDSILDMCAAPGGKSIMALQTLYPKSIVCNDVSESRTNRIKRVMKEFLYDYDKKVSNGELVISHCDARYIEAFDTYDKILVDVPCTIDRHSVNKSDNNMFKATRLKERIKLPEMQAELLTNALRLVRKGGVVVYSTCSLSPIQNDGVVHMALKKIWEETDHEISVVNMENVLEPASVIFKFGTNLGLRYGHMVVPYLPANYGPMYFCKFVKNK